MCGRFSLFDLLGLEIRFELSFLDILKPRYNIAPSQDILAIINHEGLQAVYFKWGLIPFWSKDISSSKTLINARSETVDQKASFKQSFKRRRCLIPADGFYEWKKEGNRKRPFRFTLKGGGVFSFAGLWEGWASPEGERINSCAILTTSANATVAPIHNRMPVILSREGEDTWLGADTDISTLKSLLVPYPAEGMDGYEVSTRVNSPRNDDPDIIKPV